MYKHLALGFAVVAFSTVSFGQTLTNAIGLPPSDWFQINYAANLNVGDSFVNITNSGATTNLALCGANDASCLAEPVTSSLNLCANIYTFDPQEELISCCACSVTPNGLQSLSVVKSLISNPLTPAVPSAVMVKIVATAGTCNASSISPNNLAPGLLAWGTSLHAAPTSPVSYSVTETPFAPAILSLPDFVHISSTCGFIQADGSGFGICGGCPANGLGAGTANQ